MKTFRRYIMSYICMLFIPIILLSAGFFYLTGQHYSSQIAMQSGNMLKSVQKSIDLQTKQINAYNYQTVQTSAFSTGNLENADYSAMFEVRRYLTSWSVTSAFISDLYYTASDSNYIYSSGARYGYDSFANYQLSGKLTGGELSRLLAETRGQRWVSLGSAQSPILLLISTARFSAASTHVLIARINLEQISSLVHDASEYTSSIVYLCDEQGGLLLAVGEESERFADSLDEVLARKDDWGTLSDGGETMLAVRSRGEGILCIELLSHSAAYNQFYRMAWTYAAGIAIIILLGAWLSRAFMRANYTPIRKIGELSSKIAPDACQNDDMIQDAINTINALQCSRMEMLDQSRIVAREKLMMKLIMGGYDDVQAFNAEAAAVQLNLTGDEWQILAIHGVDFSNDCEEAIMRMVSEIWGKRASELNLCYPERDAVYFVLPSGEDELPCALKTRLLADGLAAGLRISSPRGALSKLSSAYMELNSEDDSRPGDDMKPQLETLYNAIEFEEPARIHFALCAIRTFLKGGEPGIKGACFEMLHGIYSLLLSRGGEAAALALRDAITPLLYEGGDNAEAMLPRLEELLIGWISDKAQRSRKPLINEILSYLEENCCRETLTMQDVADHFGLSLSNLSHYFKKYESVSISDWVKHRRIQIAQQLLLDGARSVTEISAMVGYWQPTSFTRAFKNVTGSTPAQWRKQHAR